MSDPDEPPWVDLDDAELPDEELNRRYSVFLRWPDWRTLQQDVLWIDRDRQVHPLAGIAPEQVRAVLLDLASAAGYLHAQAASDEFYATSSGLAWALRSLGVRPVAAFHPLVWLASTPLVRALRARARAATLAQAAAAARDGQRQDTQQRDGQHRDAGTGTRP